MKYAILVLMSLLSINASADVIPNCWSEKQGEIVDGAYIVRIDASLMSAADLLNVLKPLIGQHLTVRNMLVAGDQAFVSVAAVLNSPSSHLTRSEVQSKVTESLATLIQLQPRGVTLSCQSKNSI